MKKTFDKLLKKTTRLLPEYKAEPRSWERLEPYLDFSEKITKVKEALIVYKAPENLWPVIEKEIDIKPIHSFFSWKIAASIIVIIGSGFFIRNHLKKGISYSTEMATLLEPTYPNAKDSLTLKFTQFIEYQCRNNSYVCCEPDFSAKKQKLDEVNAEIIKLESKITSYGSSPSLVKTRINLENFKAQLIKDLVKKLAS